jgi:hypothetical protein
MKINKYDILYQNKNKEIHYIKAENILYDGHESGLLECWGGPT